MPNCSKCGDSGFVKVENGVTECECRKLARYEYSLKKSGVPDRYVGASFDNFQTAGLNRSIEAGKFLAIGYANRFKLIQHLERENGLLFTGTVGTGKTHLTLAVLRELRLKYNTQTLFTDLRELLKSIQATFATKGIAGAQSEADILRPILEAEVLAIDELGAARATDWSFDVIEHIINARYNANLSTIITTNLPNKPAGVWNEPAAPKGGAAIRPGNTIDYAALATARVTQTETLGERIGARMFSRLQQMCIPIEMRGDDYRARGGK